MSNARPRSAIMVNLPRQGWTIDKEAGTGSYKDLKAVFGPDSIVLTKQAEGEDSAEVGVVSYGKSQMGELKKLAAEAGFPFAGAKTGGAGKEGGGSKLTPEQKKDRQKKAAEKRAAKKAEDNSKTPAKTPKESAAKPKEDDSGDNEKEGA